jgi:hypothetical protein
MPHGSVILTAKLIAGRDAEGERRESRPGRSGCRRCPRSGSRFGDGHQPPGSSSRPDPAGGHARERRGGPDRHSPGRQGAGGCGCPERSSSYSGSTLSDEGGSGRTRADPPMDGSYFAPFIGDRHRIGLFVRSGQAEIRTQLLCSSAVSYEAARRDQRDSVPRPPRRAAHRRPGPGQRQRHSPCCTSFPIPRQYPPGRPALYRVSPRPGSPERSAAPVTVLPGG